MLEDGSKLRAARLRLLRRVVVAMAVLVAALIAWHLLERYRTWHLWEGFKHAHITRDGRVVDFFQGSRVTSEAQAYAMFFALVADDEAAFARILDWTERQLSDGAVESNLPAWLWAQGEDGVWKIQDGNSATDADLWIAYTLLEAGRLWEKPEFSAKGHLLANLILQKNLVTVPGVGPMLLPAPSGFDTEEQGVWRFNPSYLPPFLLKRLAVVQPDQPWAQILENANEMLAQAERRGLAPDWYLCCRKGAPQAEPQGGYEAIRVYLWLAMSTRAHPGMGAVLGELQGMDKVIDQAGRVPEYVDLETGQTKGTAPVGFSAALLPYLRISGNHRLLSQLEKRVKASWRSNRVGDHAHYYDFVLGLFALGWLHGQYSFDAHGRLLTRWSGYGV